MRLLTWLKSKWNRQKLVVKETLDLDGVSVAQAVPGFSTVLNELSDREKNHFESLGYVKQLSAGEYLFQQGDFAQTVYFIESGRAEVCICEPDKPIQTLQYVEAGELLGEMAVLDNAPRSSSVICREPMTLYGYDISQLEKQPSLLTAVHRYIANVLSARLRQTNALSVRVLESRVKTAIERNILSRFMVAILWILSAYIFSLSIFSSFKHSTAMMTGFTVTVLAVAAFCLLCLMHRTKLPLSFFGLTEQKWPSLTFKAIEYSLPVMAIWLLIKYTLITFVPAFSTAPLFYAPIALKGIAAYISVSCFFLLAAYCIFVSAIELIFRAGFQSCFYRLLPGDAKRSAWRPIILSSLFYAMIHSHFSIDVSLTMFFLSVFWGWLFYKQGSFISVTVSHIVIGVWVIFITGFPSLSV